MRIYVFLFLHAVFKYILSTFKDIRYITHILCIITFLYPFRWNVSRLHFQLKPHLMHMLRLLKCIQLKLYLRQERRPPTTPNKWGIRKRKNVLFHDFFHLTVCLMCNIYVGFIWTLCGFGSLGNYVSVKAWLCFIICGRIFTKNIPPFCW